MVIKPSYLSNDHLTLCKVYCNDCSEQHFTFSFTRLFNGNIFNIKIDLEQTNLIAYATLEGNDTAIETSLLTVNNAIFSINSKSAQINCITFIINDYFNYETEEYFGNKSQILFSQNIEKTLVEMCSSRRFVENLFISIDRMQNDICLP